MKILRKVILVGFPPARSAPLVEALAHHLAPLGDILDAPTAVQARPLLIDAPPATLVLCDGGEEGIPALAECRRGAPETALVLAAEEGSVALAAAATAAGANDLLVLGPALEERVQTLVQKLDVLFSVVAQNRRLHKKNAELQATVQAKHWIVGHSAEIRRLLDQVRRVAPLPRPVLVTGERGVGKELIARALHDWSARADRPLVTLNCAAFNDALLEAELFGREKGAFTGADSAAPGKFEQADGGTLFLDEIGNMSIPFQTKILRVIEYGTFTRVGGRREQKSNVRIVAATNADLRKKIAVGEFLSDLYDRLAFEVVHVPPLRERRDDIPVLAEHYLREFAREIPSIGKKRLGREAVERLLAHPFPGNVRELKNIIERAAFQDSDDEISAADLSLPEPVAELAGDTFAEKICALERRLIHDALVAAHHNQAEAARRLGLTYHQFRYYLRKHGVPPGKRAIVDRAEENP